MPQKCFQGMQFSEASRTLHSYHAFDHIKNEHWKLMRWRHSMFFIELLLYSRPHTKCWWWSSNVATSLVLLFSCEERGGLLPVFHLLLRIQRLSISALIWVLGSRSECFMWRASKPWPLGQIWLGTYFCMAWELRVVFVILNGWKKSKE